MMRVNLLKTRVQPVDPIQGQHTSLSQTSLADEFSDQGNPVVKFIMIIIFTGGLMFYESQERAASTDAYNSANARANALEADATTKEAEAESAKVEQVKFKELETKLNVLKTLSRTRTLELKALDFLQSIIPDRVWLTGIDYKDRKFELRGVAVSEDDLTDFLKKIETRDYFKNVLLIQAREMTSDQGTVKSFQVKADLGEK